MWKIITRLKEIDEKYRTTLINFVKYKIVVAKIMKMEQVERNKVSLYLFNSFDIWKNIANMLYWICNILFNELERKIENGKRKF